jgi:signal transduction histidine kinase
MRQYTRQTIKRNFFVAMLLAPFVPVVLALGTGGYLFWSHDQQGTLDRLAFLSSHYVTVLDRYLEDCLGDLALAGVETGGGTPELRGTLERLRGKHPEIMDAALLDQDGTTLAYAGPSVYRGSHIRPGRWLAEAFERGTGVGDVAAGQLGLPHFALARRLELDGRPFVLRVSLDPEVFNRVLTDVLTEGVSVFVVNREGQVVAGSGGQILTRERELLGPVFPDRIGQVFRDARSGAAFASSVMNHGGWILAVREPAASVFGATRSALLFVGVSALFGGIVVFLSSLYLSGYVEKMLLHRDEERESLREQLYRAGRLAELGEMAAGFAHEINNPLQIMKSDQAYMEMLLKDFRGRIPDDPGFDRDVEELMSSLGQFRVQIDRCARITHSILNFGRAGAAEERNIDLARFLPEVATMIRKKAELANVALKLALPPERLVVRVDAGRLQQVLLNLLNNAMYAVGEASDGRSGEIVLSCAPEGQDKVRIAIADNGVGIDPEQRKIIFTPFFTTKPAGSGTGLGLSVCHGLVDGMKGILDFTSVRGEGSTFFIILPRVPSSAV